MVSEVKIQSQNNVGVKAPILQQNAGIYRVQYIITAATDNNNNKQSESCDVFLSSADAVTALIYALHIISS